ncbi:glycosyltransferase family 2 protein [soil metagenome]
MDPMFSFIVPVYNEEATIVAMFKRLISIVNQLDGPSEFIIVDDGSKDSSIFLIRELNQQDERVSYLSLARNFGHQIAVTAGLHHARGQVIFILDADLQDPPELIPAMIKKWNQGFEVVFAQRTCRHKENWFKRFTAYAFYRILRYFANVDIPADTGDFCLMDRKIVNILNSMPERNRYVRGLRSWVGFNQTSISYERDPRFAGDVKYTLKKSFKLAIDGLLSFSSVPLRISTYIGLISALAAIIMAILVLYWRIFQPNSPVIGFSAIQIVTFFLGAVQLVSLGIMGEYIGRIYEEVKGRPLYTLSEVGGFIKKGMDQPLKVDSTNLCRWSRESLTKGGVADRPHL